MTGTAAAAESPAPPAARTHLPGLDALRGIAILLVVLHHSWLLLPAAGPADRVVQRISHLGWAGVDLFFVLSGFLITGILLDTRENRHYFRNFFVRRVLRIFPLYYAFLVLVFWVIPAVGLMEPAEAETLSRNQPWFWTYTLNFLIVQVGIRAAAPWNTEHLWSLAVEEQFYLLWPLIVWMLPRRHLGRLTLGIVIGLGLVRGLLRFSELSPVTWHVLTPLRMDTLAMGAFLAVRAREPGGLSGWLKRARPAVLVAGIVLLALLVITPFSPQGPLTQAFGYPAIVLVSAALLVRAAAVGPMRGIWGSGALRFFGKYSYGIYVLHNAIILVLLRNVRLLERLPAPGGSMAVVGLLFAIVVIACSVLAALTSWYLLESPFLRMKDRFTS